MAINRLNPDYPDAGLVQVIPTSVTVGSGSSTVSGNGAVSFSGSSSVSLNDVFTSTYQNYRIVLEINGSTGNANLYIRYRTSSGDISLTNYERAGFKNYSSGATITAMNQSAQDKWIFAGSVSAAPARNGGAFEIYKPFDTSETMATYTGANQDGGGLGHWSNSCFYYMATSFTGFSLIADAGAISGTLRIYGYRN